MKGATCPTSAIESDVCIVGSGVAGSIVARECCRAGLSCVMLEAGPRVDGRTWPLRLLEKAVRDHRKPRMWWHHDRCYRKSDYSSVGGRKYPLHGLAVLARGGSTLGWTGDAYRMKPEDFELHTRTGQGVDWPLSYHQLEPYYRLAEESLRVSGDASDCGHPPRSTPFPVTSTPFPGRDEPFRRLLEEEGWAPMHHNVSLSSRGGVFTGDELVDELESYPNFRILLGVVAVRLECAKKQRVTAVECYDLSRNEMIRVVADRIVVCAGGIETPTLLLASANSVWPAGIGNDSGHVGRHLISHTGLAVGGRLGSRWYHGPISATISTRHFDAERNQYSGKYLLIWRPAPTGLLFVNAILEQFPNDENRVSIGSGRTRFGTPRPQISFDHNEEHKAIADAVWKRINSLGQRLGSGMTLKRRFIHAHPMCTCRMSDDPARGVTDSRLRVHGIENLFLCGSAVFSSGSASNPTVTIAALAHRLGMELANTKYWAPLTSSSRITMGADAPSWTARGLALST